MQDRPSRTGEPDRKGRSSRSDRTSALERPPHAWCSTSNCPRSGAGPGLRPSPVRCDGGDSGGRRLRRPGSQHRNSRSGRCTPRRRRNPPPKAEPYKAFLQPALTRCTHPDPGGATLLHRPTVSAEVAVAEVVTVFPGTLARDVPVARRQALLAPEGSAFGLGHADGP